MLKKSVRFEAATQELTTRPDFESYETVVRPGSDAWDLTADIIRFRQELIDAIRQQENGDRAREKMKQANTKRMHALYALLDPADLSARMRTRMRSIVHSPNTYAPGMGSGASEGIDEALLRPILEGMQDCVEHGKDNAPLQVTLYSTNNILFISMQNETRDDHREGIQQLIEKCARHADMFRTMHQNINRNDGAAAKRVFGRLSEFAVRIFCKKHPDLRNNNDPDDAEPLMGQGCMNRGNGTAQLARGRTNFAWMELDGTMFRKNIYIPARLYATE